MLTIRMQRVGRTGHAQFRMVVQDSRFHPSSGRVVAYLGSYNPHTKQSNFDKDKLTAYLSNGAQPSTRVIKLLKAEKVKLPEWVKEPDQKNKAVRNPEKRRSTRPAKPPTEPAAEEQAEPPAEEKTEPESQPEETPQPAAKEEPAAETPPAEPETEPPAEEPPEEKPAQ